MTTLEELKQEQERLSEAVKLVEKHVGRIKELNAVLTQEKPATGHPEYIMTNVPGRAGPLITKINPILANCKCGRPALVLETNQPKDTCLDCFHAECKHINQATVGDCPAGRWWLQCSDCGKRIS